LLAPALAKRREILNILVCENLHHADQVLEKALIAQGAAASSFAAVRCSVEPMMRGTDGSLDVLGESIRTVYAHRPAWRGAPPEIRGIEFRGNVDAFYARKLYTNNAGHALLAYLGALEGCELICEAIEIPAVRRPLGDLLDVAAEALAREFELDRNALAHHVESLLTVRYANRDLADPVRRVAREPLRKLGPGDRLVGLVRLLQGNGLPTRPVAPAIAGALLYEDPDDADSVKVKQMRAELGTEATLCSICGFQTDEPPVAEVLEALEALEG